MPTLIYSGVSRSVEGFVAQEFHAGWTCGEQDLLVVEPFFRHFSKATTEQLNAPMLLVEQIKELPQTLILNIAYSRDNAATFRGYLLDVVNLIKGKGYAHFTSVHVPYEACGCAMVGSVLALVFSHKRFSFLPPKRTVYAAEACPDLLYHSAAGRNSGSVYAGMSVLMGFLNSRIAFLPDLSLWGGKPLLAEYRDGDSSKPGPMREEDLRRLFGVDDYSNIETLHLCTPAAVLAAEVSALIYPD